MTVHDVLGWVEAIVAPVSVLWLIGCLALQWQARWAVALAVALAITLAQPFGIVVIETDRRPPVDTKGADPTAVHVARVLDVPVLPFVLYRDDNFVIEGDTAASTSLHARSWLWLPLLTNSTEVTPMCFGSGDGAPCWEPDDPTTGKLRLAEKDGNWWVSIRNPPYEAYTWKLTAGLASVAGLIYWIVTGLLLVSLRYRDRLHSLVRASSGAA